MPEYRKAIWKEVWKNRLDKLNNLRNQELSPKKRLSSDEFEFRVNNIGIETNKAYFAVVLCGEELVGMVMIRAFSDIEKRRLWLDHFCAGLDYDKDGIASLLLEAVLEHANGIPHFKNKGKLYIRIAPSKEDEGLPAFLKRKGFEASKQGVRDNDRHEYEKVIVV